MVPAERTDFAGTVWGRQALLSRAADLPRDFTDLLDEAAVDELLSQRGLRTPFLRVARNGSTLPERTFTAPGGAGAGIADQVDDTAVLRLFADGSTLVLQALHRTWPPVTAFCQALATELGHPVQANAYVTPPQNQGFDDHYDVHDVFVLQISGQKRWSIHAPVHPAPLRDQPWTDRRAAVARRAAEEPEIEATLAPGDCLYLPRGYLHSARALGGVSTHLTVGVHSWTRHALAEELADLAVAALADDEQARGSLALGTTFTDTAGWAGDLEQVRRALVEAVRSADPEVLRARMLGQARAGSRPAPVGPLAARRQAEELAGDAVVRLRNHLEATLEDTTLRSRAGHLDLGEDDAAAVKALLADGRAGVEVLGLELARRLVLAGVASPE